MVWASKHIPAILDAWYPGTEGGTAVANLLYGKAVPAGKLPYDWPQNVGQVPIFYSHDTTHQPTTQDKRYWNEESTPLFPFGYGLSYTTFQFSNLHVDRETVRRGDSVRVTVAVTNSGHIAADEVAQLYLHQRSGCSSRPVRELKGFQRITLAAGQTKTVNFTLSKDDLTYWNAASHSWVQDSSNFDLWAGDNSNAPLTPILQLCRDEYWAAKVLLLLSQKRPSGVLRNERGAGCRMRVQGAGRNPKTDVHYNWSSLVSFFVLMTLND